MKTFVTNELHGTRIPFLRGILTRSLQDAGLSFEEAFKLATVVRTDLGDRTEISTGDLKAIVESRLKSEFNDEFLEQYLAPQAAPARISVHHGQGKESPFSRGRHFRYLLASGVKPQMAEQVTEMVFDQLLGASVTDINTCDLGYLTWLCLRQEVGKKAAQRYLTWSEFQGSERPLILLLGGAVGCGKSTLATEIAHRLEIVRVQSTDMLREVMRMMIPERILPVLHRSSFDAWQALPAHDAGDRDLAQLVAEGFRAQAGLLAVPCEGVIHRAVKEGVSVIVEGVHVGPEIAAMPGEDSDAIVVNALLAVLKSKELKSRLRGRSKKEPRRTVEHYLEYFDSIWHLQTYLLSEADRCDVPIISNDDREKAKGEIIHAIHQQLVKHFSGTPEQVFGEVAAEKTHPDWRQYLSRLAA